MTEPLPKGQQIFLQRLLAEHTMDDARCAEVLEDIANNPDDEEEEVDMGFDDQNPKSLSQIFQSINRELTQGFGLEIATMVDPITKQKCHAVINPHADSVAKDSFSLIYGPADRHYMRIVLEALVVGGGAEESQLRSKLINVRADLPAGLSVSMDRAEVVIENMLEEHWLAHDLATSAKRRDTMNAKIRLGPRSFLELSHVLTDLGYPQEDLPQFFYYR